MALIDFDRDPPPRTLVIFGVLLAAFAVLVGLVLHLRFDAPRAALWVGGIGVGLALLDLAVPPFRRPLYLAWMYAAYPIGWLLSHALLAFVYYLLITPIALGMRLVGRDSLRRRFEKDAPSYWVPYRSREDADRYFRQY